MGILGENIHQLRTVRRNGLSFYCFGVSSPKLPDEFGGCRIMHLSDLHSKEYGENGEYLVRACAEFKPDYIFFTGDLFSRNENIFRIKSKVPLMKGLNDIAPLYYVWGNHEADIPDKSKLMNSRLAEVGVTVLRNERTRIYRGDSFIELYGLELPSYYYRAPDGGYRGLPKLTAEELRKRLGTPDRKSFNLLLAHTPLPFKQYAEWGADLTLAGHVHGGMVRIFGVGLLSPERKFFPRYTKGMYRLRTEYGVSCMEVSAGLGKFRLNNPEMVSVIELRRSRKVR